MMVIFLVGLVSMILMRTLRKDYARYSKDEDIDDMVSCHHRLSSFINMLEFFTLLILFYISFFEYFLSYLTLNLFVCTGNMIFVKASKVYYDYYNPPINRLQLICQKKTRLMFI